MTISRLALNIYFFGSTGTCSLDERASHPILVLSDIPLVFDYFFPHSNLIHRSLICTKSDR